jgi:hypothetical protein
VHIWSNRFAVSTDKLLVGLAGGFESDAIRPHVLGRFEDTLLAVMRHLTMLMLLYLGQAQSIGLRSLAGARGGGGQQRPRGFNENLAREILGCCIRSACEVATRKKTSRSSRERFYVWMYRRATQQGGGGFGGLMGIGKSKTRRYDQTGSDKITFADVAGIDGPRTSWSRSSTSSRHRTSTRGSAAPRPRACC